MPPRIRYDAEAVAFTVDGRQAIEISRDDAVVAPLTCIEAVEISSLEQALGKYEEQDVATVNYVFCPRSRSRTSIRTCQPGMSR